MIFNVYRPLKVLIFLFFASIMSLSASTFTKGKKLYNQNYGYHLGQLLDTEKTHARIEVYSSVSSKPHINGFYPIRLVVSNPMNEKIEGALSFKSISGYRSPTLNKTIPSQDLSKSGSYEFLFPITKDIVFRSYYNRGWTLSFSSALAKNEPLRDNGNQVANICFSNSIGHTSRNSHLMLSFENDLKTKAHRHRYNEISIINIKSMLKDEDQLLGWRVIFLTQSDYDYLLKSDLVMKSFEKYLKYGGKVWVLSEEDLMIPESWGALEITDAIKGVKTYQMGLGFILSSNKKAVSLINLENIELKYAFSKDHYLFHRKLISNTPKLDINVLGFLLMVVFFGLFIGPINLFWICKKNRIKLMLTTPALAILSAILFFIGIILIEGIGGEGARLALTFVDTNKNEHLTEQIQFSRTSLMLDGSFKKDNTTHYWPNVIDSKKSRPSAVYDIADQYIGSGWFNSRNLQSQKLINSSPSRSRIEVMKRGDDYYAISTFQKEPLEFLAIKDKNNEIWLTRNIPNGKEIKLEKGQKSDLTSLYPWLTKNFFNPKSTEVIKFIAKSASDDYMIESHEGIDWNFNEHYFFGSVLERSSK